MRFLFYPSSTGVLLCLAIILHKVAEGQIYNNPPCHAGMLHIFNWCEQSDCGSNCTCLEPTRVCKQVCSLPNCGLLFCSSPLTCHQSVLAEPYDPTPEVRKMVAHSPRAEQDCNRGHCALLKAIRYDDIPTNSFQSCSDGTCDRIQSTADTALQFCGNCKSMSCGGKHSQNCTQYCVLGSCEDMACDSKHCKQLCLHSSECSLTCGENAETCEQVCSHGSNCTMKCMGKSCMQSCKQAGNCTMLDLRTTPPAPTTTVASTTLSSTLKVFALRSSTRPSLTTEMSNEVEVLEVVVKDAVFAKSSAVSWNASFSLLLGCFVLLSLVSL